MGHLSLYLSVLSLPTRVRCCFFPPSLSPTPTLTHRWWLVIGGERISHTSKGLSAEDDDPSKRSRYVSMARSSRKVPVLKILMSCLNLCFVLTKMLKVLLE